METPETVLVVEDEVLIRWALVEGLRDAGFVVLEAEHADAAIEILESRPDVSLVFTDIEMPGSMDGLRLAAYVATRWPPIRIVVTSGRMSPTAESLQKDWSFLPKPYGGEEAAAVVRNLLGASTR